MATRLTSISICQGDDSVKKSDIYFGQSSQWKLDNFHGFTCKIQLTKFVKVIMVFV